MGTPPPEGHTIVEVATVVSYGSVGFSLMDIGGGLYEGTFDVELPLPVFPSSGMPAEPSQCLWSLLPIGVPTDMFLSGSCISQAYYEYTLDGRHLHADVLVDYGYLLEHGGPYDLQYQVAAVAIRTTPASPVELKSFGGIKAMFREE
jgi:hypothetical protein